MNVTRREASPPCPRPRKAVALAAALLGCLPLAHAQEASGDADSATSDVEVNWNTTVKASTKYRTRNADPRLSSPFLGNSLQALNLNAGDQNFQKKGFVSERLDLFSELDVIVRKSHGLRISGAGWYDFAYNRSTDATDPFVQQSPINQFPESTKKRAGRKAELLDWFVFGGTTLGNGMHVTGRLGSHALQYGESLFFGDNAIARAQGPIDYDKLLASPNALFKEIVRPVPQVSGQVQLTSDVALGAYYQFRWQGDRLPPAGSYFSPVNMPYGSSQPQLFPPFGGGPGVLFTPGADVKPRDNGQFGLQLKTRAGDADLGFYLAQYHEKQGQFYDRADFAATPNAANLLPGSWYYVFPEKIRTAGASAAYTVGLFNFAAEASVRDKMPLAMAPLVYAQGTAQPRYPTGRTAHINLNWLATLGPHFIANEAGFLGEIAWNRVLSTNDPDGTREAYRTRDATAMRLFYTPTYRQVLPGLDLIVPVGLGLTLNGRSAVTSWGAEGTGDASIGVEGVYLEGWRVALNYTHFIGTPAPVLNFGASPVGLGQGAIFGDRHYLSLSVRRTF